MCNKGENNNPHTTLEPNIKEKIENHPKKEIPSAQRTRRKLQEHTTTTTELFEPIQINKKEHQ